MQKYKRPDKHKGPRSIPLRNPRRVDWHRWDENNNKIVNRKPSFANGVTAESFAPSNRGFKTQVVEEYTRLVIISNEFECLTLFYKSQLCYFEHEYTHCGERYVSKEYSDRKEALALHKSNQVRWVRREPIT